jgi:hypothetical protein
MTRLQITELVVSDLLTAVAMKVSISWDITPCRPLKINRRFGEYVASIFTVEARNQHEIACYASSLLHAISLHSLIFYPKLEG